jgi:hypothetical protein
MTTSFVASYPYNNVTLVEYGGEHISIVVPPISSQYTDWRANTIGASTKCIIASTDCMLETDGVDPTCQEFSGMGILDMDKPEGNLTRSDLLVQYLFQQQDRDFVSKYNLTNPYSFMLRMGFLDFVFEGSRLNVLEDFWVTPRGIAICVACNSSVYDITYRSVNRTIAIESSSLSNIDVAQSINGPITLSVNIEDGIATGMIVSMIAAESGTDTANLFGQSYSRLSLAFSMAALEKAPSLAEQTRTTIIATCVPKAALWIMIALTVVYEILGIALTVIAVLAGNVSSVQAQLSVAGLAAASFEDVNPSADAEMKEEDGDNKSTTKHYLRALFEEYRHAKGTRGVVKRVGFESVQDDRWQYAMHKA